MKIQSRNTGFGEKPRNNAVKKTHNVFAVMTVGAAAAAATGTLARNYIPVSDEFFFEVSNKNSDKKQSLKNLMNQFVEDYASSDINEARILKTALMQSDLKEILPSIKNKGIENLLAEPSIKIIDDKDSKELKESLKVLNESFTKDLQVKDKKELLNKFENISDIASGLNKRATRGILVKQKLENFVQNIKGISENGQETISSVKKQIQDDKNIQNEVKDETLHSFKKMCKIAKNSQRPIEAWIGFPTLLVGLISFAFAVNRNMKINKVKRES